MTIRSLEVDGNKHAHWPEYGDLGKNSAAAISVGTESLVEDSYVYDSPGHAFSTWGSRSTFDNNKAVNSGYIDLRHDADFYQAAWDGWSGDGFYTRGMGHVGPLCNR